MTVRLPPPPDGDQLLRKAECAAMLGVTTRTFERYVAAGDIHAPIALQPTTKRWRRRWIEDFIDRRERGGK